MHDDVALRPKSDTDRIFTRQMSQITLTIRGEDVFDQVMKRVLKWLQDPNRQVRGIPAAAWEGKSFDIDADNSERATVVRLEEPNYWGLRLSERLKDEGRIWITEVGIAEKSRSEVTFGCRLLCAQKGQSAKVYRSIPRFVRGIVFKHDCTLDNRPVGDEPWIVESEADVDALVDFLQSPSRHHPVVAFSLPEESADPDETIIQVGSFMRRTVGYVHSVIITSDASYELTRQLGKEFSVYRQAIRTYWPGFDPDMDLSTDHPVATHARIAAWQEDRDESFEDFLVDQSLRLTRSRDELERAHPPFQQIKLIAASTAREAARKAGKSDAELLAYADGEIAAATKRAMEAEELLSVAEDERDEALALVREQTARYMALQHRLDILNSQSRTVGGATQELPDTLEDIEAWAKDHLSGAVELHERAIKAARESEFHDPEYVYKVLLMLRDHYVPMRRIGGTELLNAFKNAAMQLRLVDTKCFSQKNKAKNFGGEYFVKYNGVSRELDWHLKGSDARNDQRGFRLYYFWDDETSRVIVGYLPGHLTNDLS